VGPESLGLECIILICQAKLPRFQLEEEERLPNLKQYKYLAPAPTTPTKLLRRVEFLSGNEVGSIALLAEEWGYLVLECTMDNIVLPCLQREINLVALWA